MPENIVTWEDKYPLMSDEERAAHEEGRLRSDAPDSAYQV